MNFRTESGGACVGECHLSPAARDIGWLGIKDRSRRDANPTPRKDIFPGVVGRDMHRRAYRFPWRYYRKPTIRHEARKLLRLAPLALEHYSNYCLGSNRWRLICQETPLNL